MDKKTYLKEIIDDLDDDSIFKILFWILESMDYIENSAIDEMIIIISGIWNEISEKINNETKIRLKEYLINLKNIELQERKQELSSLFWNVIDYQI